MPELNGTATVPTTPIWTGTPMEWPPADPHSGARVFVVNPMHIVTLRDRTKSFAVRCAEKFKSFSEKWFSHVLLILVMVGYGCLGALLFQMLEAPVETREKNSIINQRNRVINSLWLSSSCSKNLSESEWKALAYLLLRNYEMQVRIADENGVSTDSETIQWTFWGSLFYCGTVFTTIGYGNISPSTDAGRAATIVYAFIGIPLMLMVLADLGKLFTRAIKAIFFYCRLFYHTGSCRKVRKVGRKATSMPGQYMAVALEAVNNKITYIPYPAKLKGKRASQDAIDNQPSESRVEVEDRQTPDQTDGNAPDASDGENAGRVNEVDDEFNLPISLALILLVTYMMVGAFIFTLWEEWDFFSAFYFVFISMSTIGFGDLVPKHPIFMMASFIYLLFGLALTSMCINVVQEKLSATFQKAKMRLGATMGLDVHALMQQDAIEDKSAKTAGELAEVHGKGGAAMNGKASRRGSKSTAKESPKKEQKKLPPLAEMEE